jgi:uncharacterized OB-fold protein
VEFEGGIKAMGQIKVEKPKIGMKLKASWGLVRVIAGEKVYGFLFHAAK